MKRTVILALAILFISANSLFALTGKEIIANSEKLAKPNSAISQVTMNIYKGSSKMEKEFTLYQKTNNGEDRVLITFTKPTKIKVLTHTHKSGEDDQWVTLSNGKVKRIVGGKDGNKGDSFVQSHMTYEDLESRDIENYDYKNIGEEAVNGEACYKVEAIKKSGYTSYDKSILYVRKSDFFIIKIDLYQKGKLLKYLVNSNIKKINNIITPLQITVSMAEEKGKTELIVQKVIYNTNIEDSKFSKEAMR